jgi:tRNA A-37 threonylcarbamoyl transferase component Bud32
VADPTRRDPPPSPASPAQLPSPLGLRVGEATVEGEIHVAPQLAGQPFVVLGPKWAWKAYRVTELEQCGTLARVRREAEVARDVAGIDGVIGATHVDEIDGWFVLQMPRMAGMLADHLAARERGVESALTPAHYARLLAGVGETLRRLHRRGIVHRDIKPANLLFDRACERLHICDFSVVKTRRSELTQTGVTLGTDSYIAPEQWRSGESTPASDQYSLGIVAREVFTGRRAAALPRTLADALRTATAVDPDDRFPGVDSCRAFGEALVRAIQAEVPQTLADRLRAAGPATRFAWAAGALGGIGWWVKTATDRSPEVILGLETLLLPMLLGFMSFAVVRFVNLPRGRRRTQSGARVLDLWWPPWLVVGAILVLGRGFHGSLWYLLTIPVAFAFAGSYPARCGYWLPALVERGSRGLEEYAWLRPLRPLSARLVALSLVLTLLAFVPVWVAHAFPRPYAGPTGADSAALQLVSAFRAALAHGRVGDACALMDGHAHTSSPCTRWMRAQELFARASEVRARRRAGRRALFDQVPLEDIELVKVARDGSNRMIYLLGYSGGPPTETIQSFGVMTVKRDDIAVVLTEGPAASPKQVEGQAAWYYEVARVDGYWRMHFTNICGAEHRVIEGTRDALCVSAMRIAPQAIAKLLRKR